MDGNEDKSGKVKIVKAFFTISRWEYMMGTGLMAGVPILSALYSVSFSQSFCWKVLVGLLIWWLGHWIGSQINCLTDYEEDKKNKSYLAEAVNTLGRDNIKKIIVIEIVVNTGIILFFSVLLIKPLLSLLWIIGLLLAFGYSVPPIRTKSRVLLNPLTLSIILFVCPMFFLYHILSPSFEFIPTLIILVFTAQAWPLFFVDEVSDYVADKASGVSTPCVNFGRFQVSLAALIIYGILGIAVISYFVLIVIPAKYSISYLLFAIAFSCFTKVTVDFYRLCLLSCRFENADTPSLQKELEVKINKHVVTPIWLILTNIVILCLSFNLIILKKLLP